MFRDFQKKLKIFCMKKNVTQYSYNQNLILNLPHNTGVFELFLSIIELLHPSLKKYFDNLKRLYGEGITLVITKEHRMFLLSRKKAKRLLKTETSCGNKKLSQILINFAKNTQASSRIKQKEVRVF